MLKKYNIIRSPFRVKMCHGIATSVHYSRYHQMPDIGILLYRTILQKNMCIYWFHMHEKKNSYFR